MPITGSKKSPLISVSFLKKRLRSITSLGFYNLTVTEFTFTIHFTLHRNEKTIAFYTSEPVENQRSPEWSYFKIPTSVQCLQDFLLRVWLTSSNDSRLFLEYNIHLDNSLLTDEHKKTVNRGNNSLWLEMFGYRFTDDENDDEDNIQLNNEEILSIIQKKRRLWAKSYNRLSIIRMNNVIHAIRTERQSSRSYLQRLQTLLDTNADYLSKIKERETRRLRIESLKQYLHFQTYLHQQRLMTNEEKQQTIGERRNQLNNNLLKLSIQQEEINSYNDYLNQSRYILRNLIQIIFYRQQEIINDIYRYIYPIHIDNQNEYSIVNIKLPQADDKIYQSTSNRERDQEIAAAIGYCSHFLLIISQFIQVPLRFPIDYHGMSTIKIYDYSLETSEFPLYPTSSLSAFRYGFYLLNRNIGQIMYHCRIGDRNTDFRNTLENLKQLIEQYFINPTNANNQITLYPSLQMIKTVNNIDEEVIIKKRHSTVSSLFSSSSSSTSSLVENDNSNQNDDMELFPQFHPTKPRLAMQFSYQLHY